MDPSFHIKLNQFVVLMTSEVVVEYGDESFLVQVLIEMLNVLQVGD